MGETNWYKSDSFHSRYELLKNLVTWFENDDVVVKIIDDVAKIIYRNTLFLKVRYVLRVLGPYLLSFRIYCSLNAATGQKVPPSKIFLELLPQDPKILEILVFYWHSYIIINISTQSKVNASHNYSKHIILYFQTLP